MGRPTFLQVLDALRSEQIFPALGFDTGLQMRSKCWTYGNEDIYIYIYPTECWMHYHFSARANSFLRFIDYCTVYEEPFSLQMEYLRAY